MLVRSKKMALKINASPPFSPKKKPILRNRMIYHGPTPIESADFKHDSAENQHFFSNRMMDMNFRKVCSPVSYSIQIPYL